MALVQHVSTKHRNNAFKFLAFQTCFAVVIAFCIGIIWEVRTGQSFFIGAMLDVLPSFVFTVYAFRFTGAQRIQQVAASMYRGETVKIMITGALFVFAIKLLPVVFPALFAGFLIMKISQFSQSVLLKL
ncbi:ATP synthase subunit I [Psychrosphaera aestuarii]|uniref:ATP synthase subunit I n=1 Tax=Psychrosphaera aestuarii TaxID=1266052 RepID=UPI001B31C6AD|nr:ATP synthase subunit I [Psychrosphaera aestuarii]